MIPRTLDWLEERTGLPSAVKHFMDEEVPASAGWHQVFGSVALFCFMLQVFTGILLAMNYAPTPGEAYNSVKYIATELTGGRMIRGLHHWGASGMIVVVVLHMIQTFVWGAYKRPREATWVAGIFLLLLTMAYGLTGYLLPWDNRAYWGTVVATQIAASAPGAGPYMTQLLGGEGIGVVTFARFYAIHVLVLPPFTMLLIALHVFLVRKHGVTPAIGDESKPKKKFYPGAGLQGHGRDLRGVRGSVHLGRRCARSPGAAGRPDRHILYSAPGMVFPVSVSAVEVLPGTA